jgi:hypothetical protein
MNSTDGEFEPKESPMIDNTQTNTTVAETESCSGKRTTMDGPSTPSNQAEEDEGQTHTEHTNADKTDEEISTQLKQEDADDELHATASNQLDSIEPDSTTTQILEPTQVDTQVDVAETPKRAGRDMETETQTIDMETETQIDDEDIQNTTSNSQTNSVLDSVPTEKSPQTLDVNANSTFTDTRNDRNTENDTIEKVLPRIRQKRKIKVLDDLEIVDPKSYRVEKIRKKVPGKLVDTFWEPPDQTTLSSFYKILHLSLNKTMERYKSQPKITEARRVLTNTWINDDPKSFNSRLALSKVPPLSTMTTKLNEVNDILNFDVVLRRKKYLETCLLAELKQLNELEEHEQNLQLSYNLDLEYLHQLKKTTGKQEQDMIKKINEKREELSLDEVEQIYDGINLTDTPNLFNPQDDDDVVLLLTKLNQHLTNVQNSSKQLGHLNDKVEVVNNILDML